MNALCQQTGQLDDSKIAAKVGEFTISVESAKRLLNKSLPNLNDADRQQDLLNAAVNRLVDRHVVYDYLSGQEMAAGKNEVRLALEEFKSELSKIDQTIEQYVEQTGQRLDEIEFDLAWRIAWNRYLKMELTDEKLKEYFDQHRREFDDSEMRVAHLLIRRKEGDSMVTSLALAENLFTELDSGKISWEEAVKEHSDAPTRDNAGEVGWITFDKPMPATFARAAFELNPGEVSTPIETQFGIHLIKCLELKEGKTGWRDALHELRQGAIRALFRELANRHREDVSTEFYGDYQPIQKNVERR